MSARRSPTVLSAAVAVLGTVLLTAAAAPEGSEQGASQAGLIFAIAAVIVVIAVIVYLLTIGRRQFSNRRGRDGNGPGGD